MTKQTNIKKQAFTLIELIIVVSILGIMAAIVLPEVQGHTQRAKEAAAKDNLRLLREVIERHSVEQSYAPGYESADIGISTFYFKKHLVIQNEYLSDIPKNPLNNLDTVKTISSAEAFPSGADNTSGWIYKISTKEIRLNSSVSTAKETLTSVTNLVEFYRFRINISFFLWETGAIIKYLNHFGIPSRIIFRNDPANYCLITAIKLIVQKPNMNAF